MRLFADNASYEGPIRAARWTLSVGLATWECGVGRRPVVLSVVVCLLAATAINVVVDAGGDAEAVLNLSAEEGVKMLPTQRNPVAGAPVTDAVSRALAEEAERDYDVDVIARHLRSYDAEENMPIRRLMGSVGSSVETGRVPCGPCAGAVWLMRRHRQLDRLVNRVPGVLNTTHTEPSIDLDALTTALIERDAHAAAWSDYEQHHLAPEEDNDYEAWRASGPQCSKAAEEIACASHSERTQLRLLAALSTERVPLRLGDFRRLDACGRAVMQDWMRLITVQ